MLVLDLWSPRPFRLWLGPVLAADEGLFWRSYQREVRAAVLFPCAVGELGFTVEIGPRPVHPPSIDRDCPSRNRTRVTEALKRLRPDVFGLTAGVEPGAAAPALSLRWLPTQFQRDGGAWQHVLVRPMALPERPPSTDWASPADSPDTPLLLVSGVLPGAAQEGTSPRERERGWRRFFVPVTAPDASLPPLRGFGPEPRVEPVVEVAGQVPLTVEGPAGSVTLAMPVYESLGRHAPRREYRREPFPEFAAARAQFPEPILPEPLRWMADLYYAAWEMLFRLVRYPAPESGLPGPYISTGSGFTRHQFVWDTSFTAMATAYGHRVIPAYCSMDLLHSRQFDGGYIPRETDVVDGLPALYEPDFSPNPPILSVAELAMARLTGDRLRLRRVYPVLKGLHAWLQHNRRLPDGTYWTTGLANGLDNSPSLGDGYPCLTAQMAHDAECLARIAEILGNADEAAAYRAEHAAISAALNARLWSDSQQIYATSLPGGGHNPNKVVTAFWPLWAGVVPPARVEALARHLKDPSSFWRYHPLPSLAADSPQFRPAGDYWLGSTWAPTNFAAIKGFERVGRHDLARETAVRHLQCMHEVWKDTGRIFENYCSEGPRKGSWSMPDYCWSAAGPIALLFEVVIGIEADTLERTIRFRPEPEGVSGVRNLPFGPATVTLGHRPEPDGRRGVEVSTDRAFTLEVHDGRAWRSCVCPAGSSRFEVGA
jgi:hypothetical protein